ncbi:hypothetical protein [Nautilia sp.]
MGKKEYLQKELDFILEKLRFWRYVILLLISGIIGIISAKKIEYLYIFLVFCGIVILFFAIKRLDNLTKEYKLFLQELKESE